MTEFSKSAQHKGSGVGVGSTKSQFSAILAVLSSDDVEEIAKKASEHGTHIHAGPTEWSIRGQNGKMKHFLGLFVFDPDGYFYEINQLVREE